MKNSKLFGAIVLVGILMIFCFLGFNVKRLIDVPASVLVANASSFAVPHIHKEWIIFQLNQNGEISNCFRAHRVHITERNGVAEFESDYGRKFAISQPYIMIEYVMEGTPGIVQEGYDPIFRMMNADIDQCWWGKYGEFQKRLVR